MRGNVMQAGSCFLALLGCDACLQGALLARFYFTRRCHPGSGNMMQGGFVLSCVILRSPKNPPLDAKPPPSPAQGASLSRGTPGFFGPQNGSIKSLTECLLKMALLVTLAQNFHFVTVLA